MEEHDNFYAEWLMILKKFHTVHYFVVKNVDWQEVRLPFRDFVPTYGGEILDGFQSLYSQEIRSLGLMISDKQVGYFNLEIAWIGGY